MTALRRASYAEALVEGIQELLAEDPGFLMIGSYPLGLGPHRAHFDRVRDAFPERILDPPTAELAQCGLGIGAALNGLRVLVDVGTASFLFQAFPQVVNEAANAIYMSGGRLRLPVVFHLLHGLRGGGAAQHSHSPQAMLWNAPGLQIVLPSTPADAKGLLRAAILSGSPTAFVDHARLMPLEGDLPDGPYEVPLGVARVAREGTDATVVASSYACQLALAAADQLGAHGIEVEIVDLRTIVPFDMHTLLNSLAKTGHLVVVDECHRSCGVAAEISARVVEEAFDLLRAPIRRVTVPDVPIPFSPVLERQLEVTPARIAAAVEGLVGERAPV